jgi:methylmalonyl-CoA mutase
MESLFSDFSPVSLADWKARLARDLKGPTFDDLVTLNESDVPVSPFYNAENATAGGECLFENPDWDICVRIVVVDEKTANKQALEALAGGASGLILDIRNREVIDYAALLEGIELPYIFIVFKIGDPAGLIAGFADYLQQKELSPGELNYVIDYDPIPDCLSRPEQANPFSPAAYRAFLGAANRCSLSVDATLFQNAGANSAFQLGCALAQMNEYLSVAEEGGYGQRISRVAISLAVGTGLFEELAKLRALRKLLPLLFDVYGIRPELKLHVVSSDLYRAPVDAYNNLLRDTISGMAGVLGGCDSLEIHHFDLNKEAQNPDFSGRIARNQQLIFKEESYLNKVADIASGSFYLETLTEEIAAAAWAYFQEIEGQGGLLVCFDQGILERQVREQSELLIGEYKSGKRVLVGVNRYPNASDMPQKRDRPERSRKGLSKINLAAELVSGADW